MDETEKKDEEKTEVSKKEETKIEAEKELQPEAPAEPEKTSEEQIEEQPEETTEKPKEEPAVEKTEVKEKKEPEKEKAKKKTEHKEDFRYIVRIANTDLDGEKTVVHGLTGVKGVGMHMSTLVADTAGIDRYAKIGDLSDAQIEKIKETLENLEKNAPGWMLNHRKDYDTGEDIHLISSNIDMRLRDEINIMKKIRSYKGIRHESGLPVRGQRTRAHGRSGLAMGVSRKGVLQAAKTAKTSSETKDKE